MPKYEQDTATLVREETGEEVMPGTVWETHHHGQKDRRTGETITDRWEFRFISRLPELGKSGKIVSTRPCRHGEGACPYHCNGTDTHEGYPPHGMRIKIADRFKDHEMDAVYGILFIEARSDAHVLELARDVDHSSKQLKIVLDYMAPRFGPGTKPAWITSEAARVAYDRKLITGGELNRLTH